MPNPETDPIRTSPVPMEQCGATLALDMVPDRWTWLILRELFFGVTRFADIQADIGIPKSVLSGRLLRIVENGLATKQPYRDGASRTRHAYVLTEKGQDLVPAILALMQWGDKHIKGGKPTLALFNNRNGNPLKIAIANASGGVPLPRLRIEPIWDRPENKL